MIGALLSLAPGLFKLGGKLIEDKDKKAEYAFKVQEMMQTLAFKLLETKTYPWIDGLVKLAYASESIIKGLFRPVVSALALAFVAYCDYKGIPLSQLVEGIMASLFPAWGASRLKEKLVKKKQIDYDDEESW